MADEKLDFQGSQIETLEHGGSLPLRMDHEAGSMQLLDADHIVLVPTPSRDPKDPLNLPIWRKYVTVFIVAIYSSFAVLGTSGMGAIITQVEAMYPNDDPSRVTDLLTYPTLFMGIGNLVAMPLCVAVGRRPVFLVSLVVLVASGIWCACSQSLGSHIAGRDIFSMAAGQSEALVAFMVQEIHFVHQRARAQIWNASIQGVGMGAMFVATTYMVPAWGVRWWYGVITIVNGVLLVAAYFLVPETMYDRVLEDEDNEAHSTGDDVAKIARVTTTTNHILDPERYGPRTWRHDLKIFHFAPRWNETWIFYKVAFQSLCIPTILWLLLLNGSFLGVYVFHSSTFAPVLLAPPFSFDYGSLGFVQLALVIANMLALPILGYGSDWMIKVMSRMNKGVFQPEFRFTGVILPAIVCVTVCVIYGQTAQFPDNWSWAGIVIPYAAGCVAFMGVGMVAITYVVDAWPAESGPALLAITAGRGFISFGLSYATVPWVAKNGYDGSMKVFAIVCGVVALCGIPCYVFGKKMRLWAQAKLWSKAC